MSEGAARWECSIQVAVALIRYIFCPFSNYGFEQPQQPICCAAVMPPDAPAHHANAASAVNDLQAAVRQSFQNAASHSPACSNWSTPRPHQVTPATCGHHAQPLSGHGHSTSPHEPHTPWHRWMRLCGWCTQCRPAVLQLALLPAPIACSSSTPPGQARASPSLRWRRSCWRRLSSPGSLPTQS